MLFLYYALLYFALSIASAAAPTSDRYPSQSSHGLNPEAAVFRPTGPAPPKVVDGTRDSSLPSYITVDMKKMKTPEELGLELGQVYSVRKHILGLDGKPANTVPVVYNGPVPGNDGKLAFVSLVWKYGELKGFPAKYMEEALPYFVSTEAAKAFLFEKKSLMITKYAYIVYAGHLEEGKLYQDIKVQSTELKKIHDYMVNDYKKRNLQPKLVKYRKDLGQTPLPKVEEKEKRGN